MKWKRSPSKKFSSLSQPSRYFLKAKKCDSLFHFLGGFLLLPARVARSARKGVCQSGIFFSFCARISPCQKGQQIAGRTGKHTGTLPPFQIQGVHLQENIYKTQRVHSLIAQKSKSPIGGGARVCPRFGPVWAGLACCGNFWFNLNKDEFVSEISFLMQNERYRSEKKNGRIFFFTSLVEISRFWSLKMSISQAGRLERKFQCPSHNVQSGEGKTRTFSCY